MSLVVPPEVARRAFENWTCAPNGCHISTYSVQSRGYAQIGWLGGDRKQHGTTAHGAVWVHLNGQVPEGMEVDHTYVCAIGAVSTLITSDCSHLRRTSSIRAAPSHWVSALAATRTLNANSPEAAWNVRSADVNGIANLLAAARSGRP
ncbi:hypothetical protein, partial [Mycobacteroides chelonae]|uniref:hypothetical protein n=1 Tax=Mycobacteroides chelonae TaxID=1774 RepID=UPI003AAB15AC